MKTYIPILNASGPVVMTRFAPKKCRGLYEKVLKSDEVSSDDFKDHKQDIKNPSLVIPMAIKSDRKIKRKPKYISL